MPTRFPPGPNDYCLGMRTMSRMKRDVLGCYSELHRDYVRPLASPIGSLDSAGPTHT